MTPYSEHQPTSLDRKGAFLHEQQDWLVLDLSQTRDSGPLERANFTSALKLLGGESETVQVHRFGHWGPGWYEIIIINPVDQKVVAIGEDIENSLADYPILDEERFSELEWEEKHEYWKHVQSKNVLSYAGRRELRSLPRGAMTKYRKTLICTSKSNIR